MIPPRWLDGYGNFLTAHPCRRCGRAVPIGQTYRYEHLRMIGWRVLEEVSVVAWCGHQQQVMVVPHVDGARAALVPTWERRRDTAAEDPPSAPRPAAPILRGCSRRNPPGDRPSLGLAATVMRIVGRDTFPHRPPGWRDWLGVAIALGMSFGFVVLAARWTSWP